MSILYSGLLNDPSAHTLIAGDLEAVFLPGHGMLGAGLADFPRAQWRLKLPAMRRLTLDERGIPTGAEAPFDGFDAELGKIAFDDGFALMAEQASFAVAGAGRRITVDFLEGYTHAQVYAPKDNDYIALEPMTAPASALTSGRGLRLVKAGERFRAAFRICIEAS